MGLLGLLASAALAWPLPRVWFEPLEHRVVVDRHGEVLHERRLPTSGHASWVELDAVAPAVVDALLASEDHRFGWHPGVDPVAVFRAGIANLRAGRVTQGGSTLAQQVARLLAGRSSGWPGKLVEAWRALRLTAHLSADEVLVLHLNRAYYGDGAIGIEAASRTYLDESAAGLSVAEAALLVGLLPAPEARSPRRDPKAARAARDRVLDRMVATGRLSLDEALLAKEEPVELRPRTGGRLAPHAVERLLAREGAQQRSTLDMRLQERVEGLVRAQLSELEGRQVDHAAVMVLDVATGDVLAAVGSGDWDASDGQVDGTRAPRSSGSTLKPFLYALAFEGDLRPGEILPDVPLRYSTTHGVWSPENYSERFHGPVRAREALASSLNVPAVVLTERVGVSELQQRLQALGFEHLERRSVEYGLGLSIGGAEVTLEELTAATASLARGGAWLPARWSLDAPVPEAEPIIEPEAAALVLDVLSDPLARVGGFGRYGPLERSYPAAVKTGTSTGYRDNWTVGGTADVTVGVWVGNFDGRSMGEVSGVTGAAPLWAAVLDAVTEREARPLPEVAGERERLCRLSGLAAGPHCPHVVTDLRLSHHTAPETCDWHAPDCAVDWPATYAAWATEQGRGAHDPACRSTGPAHIASPADGAVFFVDAQRPQARQRIPLRAATPLGARRAVWRVDGDVVAEVGPPFEWLWQPIAPGPHRIALEIDGRSAEEISVHVGASAGR